jgi:inosine-uridine nucleoside N-ribohydrolase
MDVDTGVDDCVALLYALGSPEVDLLGVTCCAGNVPAPRVAANTLAVLELAGAGQVEVALVGAAPDEQTTASAASHAAEGVDANGDIYASAEYRRHLAQVYTRRAVAEAAGRIK